MVDRVSPLRFRIWGIWTHARFMLPMRARCILAWVTLGMLVEGWGAAYGSACD